jgi:ATP-dependent helicase/nuclease subunit B
VATREEWSLLQSYVRQTIRQIGTRITNGEVGVEPYRMGDKIACTFCNYKSICEFDPLFAGNDYRVLQPRSKEQVWQAMTIDIANEPIEEFPMKLKGVK